MSSSPNFTPSILGFVCHWWGYGAADLAGVSRLQYTTDVRLIRVMCTGRVDLEMVLKAFYNGADGVFIGGCRLGECNYITHGNYTARNMTMLCKRLLEKAGLSPDRIRIEFMTSGDGILFAEIMNEFGRQVREAGPLGTVEGMADEEIRSRLDELIKLVPFIKVKCNEKLRVHPETTEEAERLFTVDEIDTLLNAIESYHIDPDKCRSCGTCARKCPVDAISGEKKIPYMIDQEKCIKCGTCLNACPSQFGAIEKHLSQAFC